MNGTIGARTRAPYYIVMEFVRAGPTFKTAIIGAAINQRKVAEIGSQVCQEALSVAHWTGHHPPRHQAAEHHGAARRQRGRSWTSASRARRIPVMRPKTSSVLGKAHYISPEQAQGKGPHRHQRHLLAGHRAVKESATDACRSTDLMPWKRGHEAGQRPARAAARDQPDIDPALEAIIMKAIAKNLADRFATAKDMRLALNDYLAGRPVNLRRRLHQRRDRGHGRRGAPCRGVADGTAKSCPAMGGASPCIPHRGAAPYNANNTSGEEEQQEDFIAIVIGIIAALAVVGGIAFVLIIGQRERQRQGRPPLAAVVGQTVGSYSRQSKEPVSS